MLRTYLTAAFRHFRHNKLFAFLNVIGLAIGISAGLVIYQMVHFDWTFDKFEAGRGRIYRVVADYTISGKAFHAPGVPQALPAAVSSRIPGLDVVAPIRLWKDVKVTIEAPNGSNPRYFKKEGQIIFADSNYFNIVQYDWIAGSAASSLLHPYQTVLTEQNAKRYFNGLRPDQIIGKEVIFNDTVHTVVSGIVKELSGNTDFTFNTFISRPTIQSERMEPSDGDSWTSAPAESQLFIKLLPGQSPALVQYILRSMVREHAKKLEPDITIKNRLQPLEDLHFNADYGNFDQRTANRPTLWGLSAVAAFLLLLASINFINLTTAQGSRKAKEIGIRKTLGSSKKQLMTQFFSETFLLTSVSGLLALGLSPCLLAAFAGFVPEGLHFNLLRQPGILLILACLVALVGFASGLYPAWLLAGFTPASVLKGQFTPNEKARSSGLRKLLTVCQFVIAQVFIIGTILVTKQVAFTLNNDLGFRREAIIYFETDWHVNSRAKRFLLKEKLQSIPGISMVSLSNNPPTSIRDRGGILKYFDGHHELSTHAEVKVADTNYIKLYQIRLMAGTNIPPGDTIGPILINETGAGALGFRDVREAVGKFILFEKKKLPIAGVFHDLHQKSLHEPIGPMVISSKLGDQLLFNVALQPQNPGGHLWEDAIRQIEKAFKEVYPNGDFDYHFLDDTIAQYYTAEQETIRLLFWATALAVLVSALGLLGLVVFVTNQRTYEVAIRKVLGATVRQIVFLLSLDFLKVVALSFLISIPFAWYGAHRWLETFAYKTSLNWWIFAGGGLGMAILSTLVLTVRIVKAAHANPVTKLRNA